MLVQARAKSAEAAKMVNEQLSGMLSGLRSSTDSSMAAFAKMEEKVMALEAEAEGAAMVRLLAPDGLVVSCGFLYWPATCNIALLYPPSAYATMSTVLQHFSVAVSVG